jgi:phage-related protein
MSLATGKTGNDLSYRRMGTALVRRIHPKRWQIACFRDAAGRQPVIDYISSLTNLDDLQLIFHVVQHLSHVGLDLVDTKMVKHIEGPIFELRKDRHRIMFAGDMQRNRFVLLSTFYKDSEKTPREEIERAQTYWMDYLNTGRCEIFAVRWEEF